jgi:hypothetical protein
VDAVMNLRVPKNAGKFLSSCINGGFSAHSSVSAKFLLIYKNLFLIGNLYAVHYLFLNSLICCIT